MGKNKKSGNPNQLGLGPKSKKKGGAGKKTIHPNSRKAVRVHAELLRSHKLADQKTKAGQKRRKQGEVVAWFKHALTPGKTEYNYAEVTEMIGRYLRRHSDELAEIKVAHKARGRRDNASREEAIKLIQQHELEQYKAGMELPDLRRPDVVKELTSWDYELNLLPRITMGKFKPLS